MKSIQQIVKKNSKIKLMWKSIKKIKYLPYYLKANLIYRFIFTSRPKYNKKYDFVICGIFKDEAPFLKEWIEYHKMIGIKHFYLYNNNSTDNYKEVLAQYIKNGLVTLTEWPYDQGQISSCKDFYENYRNDTQWYIFLDMDEFIVPKNGKNLKEWLQSSKLEKYPAISIYWKMFGSSGLLKHDYNKLVIEQYTNSWKGYDKFPKVLVNADYEFKKFELATLHVSTLSAKKMGITFTIKPIDMYGQFVNNFFMKYDYPEEKSSIQLNHYWSKAWDIYNKKRIRKDDACYKENPKCNIDFYYEHELNNTTCDYTIFRFVMMLKHQMNKII